VRHIEPWMNGNVSASPVYRAPNIFGGGSAIDAALLSAMVGIAYFAQGAVAVGGPVTQVQEPTPGSAIPFRRATTFRTSLLQSTAQLLTTSAQNVDIVIEGSGYIYAIDLHVNATAAGNAAAVAFQEDGPWSAMDSVVFRDVNGELLNLSGYHLRLANLYAGYVPFKDAPVRAETAPSGDTTNIFSTTTGAVGAGGSFRFHLLIPVGLNRRELRGILGNQDRAQKYSLRDDYAASGSIYSVAPTTLPTMNVERVYENYAVPGASNANGAAQSQFPDDFGILHYITQSVNASPPAGSATVNHYLARLGNTIRVLIVVLRSNGTRGTAESNMPTRLQFNLGDTPLFVETVAYRRMEMWRRYGFDAPNGVLVFDFMTDIYAQAGYELGDDYLFTNGLVNAQFQFTYPSGMGSTNNSFTTITDDLVIPPTVDIYA
jgi:hypothetical protein